MAGSHHSLLENVSLLREVWRQIRGLPRTLTGFLIFFTPGLRRRLTIGVMLELRARLHPGRPFLLFGDESWTWGEANARVNQLAAMFGRAGVNNGDCVALMTGNRPVSLLAMLALAKRGATAAMMNVATRGEALAHCLRMTKPVILVADPSTLPALLSPAVRPVVEGLRRRLLAGDPGSSGMPAGWLSLAAEAEGMPRTNPPETGRVRPESAAFYVFTSGTTGRSKAAIMTHARWIKAMLAIGCATLKMRRRDVLYCPLPLFHNNALTVSLSSVMAGGATFAIGRGFSAGSFWQEIERHGATMFCYVGEICRYLLANPPAPGDGRQRIRTIVGNGLRPEIWQPFKQRFGIDHIAELYGASESNAIFINLFNLNATAGFCPMPFRIIAWDHEKEAPARDEDGAVRLCRRGEAGLLLFRVSRSSPFDGYPDEEETNRKLRRDLLEPGDCWFASGDLVIHQGLRHVAFLDRLGDTFRWKGENVATTEVESVLNTWPGIRESVVYGVRVPLSDGRAGMAAIIPDDPETFSFRGLHAHLSAGLPPYAIPCFLRIRKELEVSATFKYQKVRLREEGFQLPAGHPDEIRILQGNTWVPLTADLQDQVFQSGLRPSG